VGNASQMTATLGMDATPVPTRSIAVNVNPVFTTPFPNPVNPIGETGTCVKKLQSVEVTSPDPDFNVDRSTARLLSYVAGPHTVPVVMKTTLTREADKLVLTVLADQNGDGQPDFENPAPGQYLPPGVVDPRFGRNDGLYVVEVTAYDKAGNVSTISREVKVDTTAPQVKDTFPRADVTLGPPLRFIDAIVIDPKPASGADPGGVNYDHFFVTCQFKGNSQTAAQTVHGVGFVHRPNSTDPTVPSFNPDDVYPKLLYEFTDTTGHVTPLPDTGKWDGVYEIQLTAYDNAGNEVTGSAAFTYSSTAPADPTTSTNLMITMR
jgi:hypothetical protein